jgi:hypothetical protein
MSSCIFGIPQFHLAKDPGSSSEYLPLLYMSKLLSATILQHLIFSSLCFSLNCDQSCICKIKIAPCMHDVVADWKKALKIHMISIVAD